MPDLQFDLLNNVYEDEKAATQEDFFYFWFAVRDRDNSSSNKIRIDDKQCITEA